MHLHIQCVWRWLAMCAMCAIAPCLAQNEGPAPSAAADAHVAINSQELTEVLAGIVHYTRWPQPAASVQVCVDRLDESGASAIARRLGDGVLPSQHVEVVGRSLAPGMAASLLDCQVIYFGAAPASAWRPLLVELVNHPILTVGVGDDFCSYGGLFCLESSPAGIRIKANLDSISRSGLRVNPQLLRLTQRDRGAR